MKQPRCKFFSTQVKKWNSNKWGEKPHKKKQRLTPVMALGAATLLGSHLGWAEDSPAMSLPDVVVTGDQVKKASSPKYTEPLRDIPQTITVIDSKTMEEQGATTLRDVLRNVPGISIQAGEGGVPAGDNLSIRGFNARTDVFIDGVRDFGGYSRDSFNFEQVEVIKGPASSYSGRGSTGGSINMSSKAPRLQPFAAASVGIGTDEYFRTTVDLNQPLNDNTALRVNALWHSQEIAGRDTVEGERWGIAPTLEFGLGMPTRLKFGYFHLSQDNQPDYGIPWVPVNTGPMAGYSDQPSPVDYSNYYGLDTRDFEKIDTDIAMQEVSHDVNQNLNIRNYVQLGRTKRDSVITAPRFVDLNPGAPVEYGTTLTRQIQSRDQVDSIVADQLDVTSKFRTASIEHALVSGVELALENSRNYPRAGVTNTTNLFNPDPHDPNPGPVTRTGGLNEGTAKSVGVYAFDTIKLNNKFQVVGGIRWDQYNVRQTTTTPAQVSSTMERTDENVSWRGGLVFKPIEIGSVYVSYGTSFNPSAENLTPQPSATSRQQFNVDPEQNETFEAGTKWDVLNQRLSLAGAVFRTIKTNARTVDPTDPNVVTVLNGEQNVDGVELSASGSLTEAWAMTLAYTFMNSEVTKSNNPAEVGSELANTPENTASLWTTYGLTSRLDLGLGAQFVDSRKASTTNNRVAPSYWLGDAMAAYAINKHFTLRLNAYNLLDHDYIDRVGGGHFVPGTGRSATLATEIKF